MAYFFGFAAVAGYDCCYHSALYLTPSLILSAFGGLIAFGIQQASTAVSNWRLLFIVEGVPTVLLGIMTLFLLPDRPEETPFLNEKERRLQRDRMNRGISADVGRTINKGSYYCLASS